MQKRSLPITLLLDDLSRTKMKTNVADLILVGVQVVSSLREVNDTYFEESNILVVLDGALRKSSTYSDLVLYKKVWNLHIVFISQDEVLLKSMSSIASCFCMDPSIIDYERLYGIASNDKAVIGQYSSDYAVSEMSKIAKDILNNPNSSSNSKRVSEAFLAVGSILLEREQENNELMAKMEEMKIYLQGVEEQKVNLEQANMKFLEHSLEMNKTLSQYEVILARDVYDKVNLSRYTSKPNIIYIKVYEELIYMDSFLETLSEMFRYHGRMGVKLLRLFDSSASKKVLAIPSYYKKIENEFTNKDLVNSDFLYKVGPYRTVLDNLLTNSSGVGLLIIVDQKDHADTVISGASLQLATCRSNKRMSLYGLDPRMTIVNDGIGELSWDYYPEFSTLTDRERFLFLSSRPVMQAIFEMEKAFRSR